jgi:hypothetical protein
MTSVFLGGAVGTASMTFMMCFVFLKIVDKPYGYYRENWSHEKG